MRVAMLGTRGVPAHYGGFETAVEEIGARLVDSGHEVVVYCRDAGGARPESYRGMDLVHLPAVRSRALETLSHTALSVAHLAADRRHTDAAIVFNAANAPFAPVLRARRIPFALHVDGLEWRRAKWGGAGRRYYRLAESLAVRWADTLIADAQGIADYYDTEFEVPTVLLAYGAPILAAGGESRIAELGLRRHGYHLVVARFEPENHVEQIVAGYHRSTSRRPLVVVGSAPYADDYTRRIHAVAQDDERIRMLGGVWDQDLLDELYAGALTYVHGHSVGGTNPSLLRAMGAGAPVLAYDVGFNREVVGTEGEFFADPAALSKLFELAEAQPEVMHELGLRLRARAQERYQWDAVATGYADLLARISAGYSTRGTASGRRRNREPEPAIHAAV